jgi:uncharacterized protein
MQIDQNKVFNYHVIQNNDNYYLFDPLSMELYNLKENEAIIFNEIESNSCFHLDHDGNALEFGTINYSPSYEINILLTANCNLNCSYCFTKDTYRSVRVLDPLIGIRFVKNMMHHYNIKFLKFFGGEPLLTFDSLKIFVESIISYCRYREYSLPKFGVVTNGLSLSSEIIQYLKDMNFTVTISYDGIKIPEKVLFLRFPNKKIAKLVFDNILEANDKRLDVSIQTTYTKNHVMAGISPIKLLDDFREIGIKCIHIMPEMNVLSNLSLDQIAWIKEEFKKTAIKSIFSIISDNPIILVYVLKVMARLLHINEGHFICGAGIDSITIMPSGEIYPCYLLYSQDLRLGNTSEESFDKILNRIKRIRKIFVDHRKINILNCSKCWARTICASCYGPSYLKSYELNAPGFVFCEILRATIEGCLSALAKIKSENLIWDNFLNKFAAILKSSGQPIFNIKYIQNNNIG